MAANFHYAEVRTCECGHAGRWHREGGPCRIDGCGCPMWEWATIRFRNPRPDLPEFRNRTDRQGRMRMETLNDA